MATEVGSAYVSIVPSAKGFGSSLNRGIGRQVDASGKSSGRRFGKGFTGGVGAAVGGVGRSIAAIAGPLAVLGGIKVLGGFVADARESARISALTAQAIKSTGGAANVTAKQVGRLSTAISNKTGVDDEQIQSGANLLLTFTNVRNEVGKGNKIFNRANQAVTDMSAALGQDTKSSAIQLGKALNDPVKGITALSRVGVAFTEQQKAQITAMVENGNQVGAQKVILAELGKEFGGAAAAMATPGDKLKVTLGNLGESIGAQLIPHIDTFARFMVKKGIPAVVQFGGFLKANVLPPVKQFAGFLASNVIPPVVKFAKAAFALGQVLIGHFRNGLRDSREELSGLPGFAQTAGLQIRRLGGFLTGTVIPALKQFGGFLQSSVLPRLQQFGGFLQTKVLPVLVRFGGFVKSTIIPALVRFGGFITTSVLPALVRMGVFFQTRILPVLRQVGAFLAVQLGPAFRAFGAFITGSVLPALQGLGQRFVAIAPTIGKFALIVGKIIAVLAAVAIIIIGKVLPPLFKLAGFFVHVLFAAIGKALGIVAAFIRIIIRIGTVVARVAVGVGQFVGKVVGFFTSLRTKVMEKVSGFGALLFEAGKDLIRGLVNGIKSLALAPVNAVKGVAGKIGGAFKGALGIGSPSKVFAGFGVNINEGLLLGLRKSEGLLRTGTRAQASTLTNSFRPPAGAARPADVRRGGQGGQIHVEVHNPKPERASESVPRAVQRATRNAGWAAA